MFSLNETSDFTLDTGFLGDCEREEEEVDLESNSFWFADLEQS